MTMLHRATFLAALGASALLGCSSPPTNNDVQNTDAADVPREGGNCGNMSDAGNCYRVTRCDNQPFCPAQVTNDPMRPSFIIQQIDIEAPASLASTPTMPNPVAGVLNTALTNGTFFWGISFDFSGTSGMIRTGSMQQDVMPELGYGYLRATFHYMNGGAPMPGDPNRWNPVTGTVTLDGEVASSETIAQLVVPVYSPDPPPDGGSREILTELPFRNARMHSVHFTEMRNCIGLAKPQYNSCLSNNRWNTQDSAMMPSGVVEADVTIEDARNVAIPSLMTNLCNIIAGADCAMVPQDQWPTQPDRTVPPSTTPNAWHLRARFAAVAARIE